MTRQRKYSDDLNPRIKRLYKDGFSLSEIACLLDCHPEVVKRRLKTMGVKIRNRSEAMRQYHAKRILWEQKNYGESNAKE
jgi:DNA-binding transcriptional MerR regulator